MILIKMGKNPSLSLSKERVVSISLQAQGTERGSRQRVTAMEVSGSLSLEGVTGGGEGSVVGKTQESGGSGMWWGRLGRVQVVIPEVFF